MLEILINENCNFINIKLNELTKKYPNLDANIIGIIRYDKFLIPKKNDDIKKNNFTLTSAAFVRERWIIKNGVLTVIEESRALKGRTRLKGF